jgi:hypothetical protein
VPPLIAVDESPAGYSWQVALQQSPLPLHQPELYCQSFTAPDNASAANGEMSLNWLSQPRGPVQSQRNEKLSRFDGVADGALPDACHLQLLPKSDCEKNFDITSQKAKPGSVHYRQPCRGMRKAGKFGCAANIETLSDLVLEIARMLKSLIRRVEAIRLAGGAAAPSISFGPGWPTDYFRDLSKGLRELRLKACRGKLRLTAVVKTW